jgi:hypothetical protein
MPESLLAGTASLFYGLQQGRLGYSHRIARTIPHTARYLFTLRYTDECRPRKSRVFQTKEGSLTSREMYIQAGGTGWIRTTDIAVMNRSLCP